MATKWTTETIEQEALRCTTRYEFNMNHKDAYLAAHRRGILDQVCAHMDVSATKPWSLEDLKTEASKYATRWEFQQESRGAYLAAYKRDILDVICSHMSLQHHPWTEDELKEEALKFDNRNEFKKNSRAYSVAYERGILDSICSHMKLSRASSSLENELFDKIKEVYPTARKYRIKQNLIPQKPHIQGFEIDIYVPELKKGVEFDGKYWHSYEGLKRARPQWPEEDIENYHAIKDEYFESKGIKLLHVKEQDYLNDSILVVDACLAFLRS